MLRKHLYMESVLHSEDTTLQTLKKPGCIATSKFYMQLRETINCAV